MYVLLFSLTWKAFIDGGFFVKADTLEELAINSGEQ